MSLGARIRSLREDLGLDSGQLAYKAGVHPSTIFKIENGDRPNTSGVIIADIAAALNTTTDYLLGRTNDPSPQTRPAGIDTNVIRMAYQMIEIWQELGEVSPDLLEQAIALMTTQTELFLAAASASRRGSDTGAETGEPCPDGNHSTSP